MQNLNPVFIDITNWNKIPYSSTGGTRAKNIYVFPDDEKEYFFKYFWILLINIFKEIKMFGLITNIPANF